MTEPYMLISQSPRYSYYIFDKRSNGAKDINNETKCIVLFGNDEYIKKTIKSLQNKLAIDHIEYLRDKIVAGHDQGEIYDTAKIIAK